MRGVGLAGRHAACSLYSLCSLLAARCSLLRDASEEDEE